MERDPQAIQRVLVLTFFLNLLAAGAKLGVGLWTGALSLTADGLDTLFDSLSNVIGVIGVRLGSRPPDEEHPYGHRKFETVAALVIASLLFVTAWELATGAVQRLLEPPLPVVNHWSMAALAFSALVQGCTGWWEIRQGHRLQSEVLVADGRHAITSIYVSGAVLLGLGLVRLGYPWADPLVALLVAGVIAKIGVETVLENLPPLVDQAPLPTAAIGQVVSQVTGVESYHRIRSRGTPDNVAVDLHVRVDPRLPMQAANAIADEVRRRLLELPGVTDVTVHVEAARGPESATHITQAVKLAGEELGVAIHEIWVQQAPDGIDLHLHAGVDPNLTLAQAHELVDRLEQVIKERLPEVRSVSTHIETAVPEILPTARVSRGLQERVEQVVQKAVENVPGICRPHHVQVRQVEGRLFISLEALVDGDLPVSEAHELSTRLQEQIRQALPNVGEVLVHLEPVGEHA